MIMDGLLPTCREVTRKLAEGEFEILPWHRRLLARLHLGMCGHCSRFARQLGLISEALRKAWKRKPDPGTLDGAKRRILSALRKI
ncbi:MAG: zf-HC2 domain-containing protein [Elusimicrobia bacterium]|nr:zf-HC2 domain-containing protein [Elusimicrobiota bacterium]